MLSVIIIAKNEEANIRRCLASVQWADELIVLDSGSSDNTIAIAKEYTDKVYSTDWQGYGIQKQRALSLATEDWVLNLDADETVDDQLKTAIIKAITSDDADAYRIPICMNFYGFPLRFSSSPKRHVRLFKRAGARYSSDIVHEKIVLAPEQRISKIKKQSCITLFKMSVMRFIKSIVIPLTVPKLKLRKTKNLVLQRLYWEPVGCFSVAIFYNVDF